MSFRALSRVRLGGLLILLGCWLGSIGCVSITPPDKFVLVAESSHSVQMVSADDALFWVREFKSEVEGDLEFWGEALRSDFEQNRGYTILDSEEFTDKKGRKGLQLLAEVSVDGVAHRYLCLLSLRRTLLGEWIRVAEYTAPKGSFDAYVKGVREAALAMSP